MKKVAEYLEIINKGIAEIEFPSEPKMLYEPIRYALTGGGKRIRPVLLLAAAEASGAAPEDALDAALAIEMYHNFTLVHDDMMDRSALRRGRPSVYKKWNESVAILSGDAMLTYSSILLNKSLSAELGTMNLFFNRAAMQVYEGQQYDMDFEGRNDVTSEEYIKMIRLKTASLISAAAAIGTLFGTIPSATDAMMEYGDNLGLAFQLQDDYLDTFGNVNSFGKPIGGDIVNRKKTWLLINAMSQAPQQVEDIYQNSDNPEELVEKMKHLYCDLGLDEHCNQLINYFTARSERALSATGFDEVAVDFFTDFAHSLIKRKK